MRIFVAGATGAVGGRLVPLLVSNGHEVVGLTRTPEKAEAFAVGAQAAVADGLNAYSIKSAVVSARPDIIVHEMTDLRGRRIRAPSIDRSPSAIAYAPRASTIC